MDVKHKIYFNTKTTNFEKLSIYIDDKLVQRNGGQFIWYGDTGKHTIRVEQDKIIKSKYYWFMFPVIFFLSLLSGEGEFDGKTPYYALYEAEFYIDKDISMSIELFDVNRNMKKSKQGFSYKIDVDFPKEMNVKIIKSQFTVKTEEKARWLLYHMLLWNVSFGFLTFIFAFSGIKSWQNETGISIIIMCWGLVCLSIVGWIFFIGRYYKWSNGEY